MCYYFFRRLLESNDYILTNTVKPVLKGTSILQTLSIMASIIFTLRNILYNIYLYVTDNCSYMWHILRLPQVEFICRIELCIQDWNKVKNMCYIVKREDPSSASTFDSCWNNMGKLVERNEEFMYRLQYVYLFFRNLQKAFLTRRKHDTPQTHYSLISTVRLYVILSDTLHHKISSWLPPFSDLRTFYFDKKRNRHIQSVNLYLWYKEDFDPWHCNVAHSYCRR